MKILLLGGAGFIGSNLTYRLLKETNHDLIVYDTNLKKLDFINEDKNTRVEMFKGNALANNEIIKELIMQSDLVINLIAIANPAVYVENPLLIYELDCKFANEVTEMCYYLNKRLIFFSTSEIYGKNPDNPFVEYDSNCVYGQPHIHRWIYARCKSLAEHVIHAYSCKDKNFNFTIVRPFNWIGPKLDDLILEETNEIPGRVIVCFLSNLIKGENLKITGSGFQSRCFCYIRDAIDCMMKIIENKDGKASNKTFNIGNPFNNYSMLDLAKMIKKMYESHPSCKNKGVSNIELIDANKFYNTDNRYEDIDTRIPCISEAISLLDWNPQVSMHTAIERTVNYYMQDYLTNEHINI